MHISNELILGMINLYLIWALHKDLTNKNKRDVFTQMARDEWLLLKMIYLKDKDIILKRYKSEGIDSIEFPYLYNFYKYNPDRQFINDLEQDYVPNFEES